MNGPSGRFTGPGEPDDNGGPGGTGEGSGGTGGGRGGAGDGGVGDGGAAHRIPPPRSPAEDSPFPADLPDAPLPGPPGELPDVPQQYGPHEPAGAPPGRSDSESSPEPHTSTGQAGQLPEQFDHRVLKSLLGAWALAACSVEETAAVEAHLSDCGACADEALRLLDAVGLLHPEDSLDLDPTLRSQVLEGCMGRRPPRVPVPEWAAPYDAESSRLDALLRDMADAEWLAPVLLRWFDGQEHAQRETTVGGVIAHLFAVDGLVATALGLPDPLATGTGTGTDTGTGTGSTAPEDAPPAAVCGPASRTEEFWRADTDVLRTPSAREPWRDQGHALVRSVSFAGEDVAGLDVLYGGFRLPVRDALLDRAFECWMHGEDIADAIDYPYAPPQGRHMHHMVDLAARLLPGTIARRRRTGLSAAPRRLTTAGAPGRALHLEVEGDGGGDWYIPLDSPAASAGPGDTVAHVALDRYEFCQLVAGHVPPLETAAGQDGDREAVRDVLFAAASLSRM